MLKRFSCGIDEPQWNRIEPSNLFLISWRSWRPWRLTFCSRFHFRFEPKRIEPPRAPRVAKKFRSEEGCY
jgi:hypothetical protein